MTQVLPNSLRHAGALAALLFLSGATAQAETCSVPAGADLALIRVDANTRLHFLQDAMNNDAAHANAWRWGWVGGYGAVVLAQGILVPFMPHELDRIDRYVGAVSAVVGMIPPLLTPPQVLADGPAFDARVQALSANATPLERCELLAWGETLAARSALAEARAQAPLGHVIKLAFNLVTTAFLGFVFNDWVGAVFGGGAGIVLGEVQVLTAPTKLVDHWEHYKAGSLAQDTAASRASSMPKLNFSVQPGYVGVNGSF